MYTLYSITDCRIPRPLQRRFGSFLALLRERVRDDKPILRIGFRSHVNYSHPIAGCHDIYIYIYIDIDLWLDNFTVLCENKLHTSRHKCENVSCGKAAGKGGMIEYTWATFVSRWQTCETCVCFAQQRRMKVCTCKM